MPRHILSIGSLAPMGRAPSLPSILRHAKQIKKRPEEYHQELHNKTLLMLFQKPSLRTRLSFEVAMSQLGGDAIFYPLDGNSPMKRGKETVQDTAKCISRYADCIMARLNTKEELRDLANNADVPVINALDDWGHPCQILGDILTIQEKFPDTAPEELKLAYLGDLDNNVAYDLMRAGAMLGMTVNACGPEQQEYQPEKEVLDEVKEIAKLGAGMISVTHDALRAVEDAHIVYTDSWMSYHLPDITAATRMEAFAPYAVTADLMANARPDAIFMHCLPATRGAEVAPEVIDGPQSVIYDQAENRLHAQKGLLVDLLRPEY